MANKTTRRRFLRHSTETVALTAAVSTLGGVHSLVAATTGTVNLGIIGCGVFYLGMAALVFYHKQLPILKELLG